MVWVEYRMAFGWRIGGFGLNIECFFLTINGFGLNIQDFGLNMCGFGLNVGCLWIEYW